LNKVLILSYFFPPCNLTAAQRIQGWANYLKAYDYEPIVITRNWDIQINQPEDVLKSTGTEVKHEKNDRYEAYYLPYKASFRDRLFTKYAGSPIQKISRIFTFTDLIFENFFVKSIPHANLYDFARKYLKEHPEVKNVIISGNPFNQFYFGYLLEKEFDIKWIADYRDDWNTTEIEGAKKGVNSIIQKLQQRSEKKWVQSAQIITSVSPYYVQKIATFVDKPGETILNGFEVNDKHVVTPSTDQFVITYNGSLYPTQPIEPILDAIHKLIKEGFTEIELRFPGLAFNTEQFERVKKATQAFSNHVFITKRIPKKEVLAIQRKSDLLVMISHSNTKGIPSSKLYEYVGLQKPILLYPNDQDIIEETLLDTGLGIICTTETDIYDQLKSLIESKRNGNSTKTLAAPDKINFYSRKIQTKKLAGLLDEF